MTATDLDAPTPDVAAGAPAADAALREDVRALIRSDPSLVLDDPAVMQALIDAGQEGAARQVTDLRGAMVARLERRLSELEETHRSVVAAAYQNVSGTDQIHRAALAVLEPTRFSDLLKALEEEIPVILAVDEVRLCLEGEGAPGGEGALMGVAPGAVDRYLALGRPGAAPLSALRAVDRGVAQEVFGPGAAGIGSEAVVRLDFGEGARPGMLVFGAEDPERFSPDQGSDLVLFLGGVVQRAIRRWVTS